MLVCGKCGKELEEGTKVCPECGESVEKSGIADGKVLEEISKNDNSEDESIIKNNSDESELNDDMTVSEKESEIDDFENSEVLSSDAFGNVQKSGKAEKFVKGLFLGIVCIVIIGVVCISAVTIYNSSPERIFEQVKESGSFKKYITEKGYSVDKYYLADIIGGDSEKELLFEINSKDGISMKMVYIASKDNSGEYKIGMFNGIGGELIENIEMSASNGENEKEFLVCLKNVLEAPKESIDFVKLQLSLDDDEKAKEAFDSMYGSGLGFEQYGVFKMSNYTFVEYGGKNAEDNNCDFIFGLTPEKVLVKSKDPQTEGFAYQYMDFSQQTDQTNSDETAVSEEEFNKYIDEFKNGKEVFESFDVSEDDVEAVSEA